MAKDKITEVEDLKTEGTEQQKEGVGKFLPNVVVNPNILTTCYVDEFEVGIVGNNVVIIPKDGFNLPWNRIICSKASGAKLLQKLSSELGV